MNNCDFNSKTRPKGDVFLVWRRGCLIANFAALARLALLDRPRWFNLDSDLFCALRHFYNHFIDVLAHISVSFAHTARINEFLA